MRWKAGIIFGALACALPAPSRAPQQASAPGYLTRKFTIDAMAEYRIQLTVHSELTGEQTETIGAKTYVHPFTRTAGRTIEWRATRRVVFVEQDGNAEIEETLDHFNSVRAEASTAGDPEARKLDSAIETTFSNWSRAGTRTLHYRESPSGQLQGVDAAGVPRLEEAQPPLLTLWLLRAVRPTAAIPARAIAIGDRWQEPRSARLEGWSGVEGIESGEWLAAPGTASLEPATRLLVVQQIIGTIITGPEKPEEGEAHGRFHAESLSTISLRDGRVLAATRSATREDLWTLAPVVGMQQAPQFGARFSAQVEIEECHGACAMEANNSGGDSR